MTQGSLGFGVDASVMRMVAEEVKELVQAGVRVAIVVGGGNYFRGANAWQGLDRATADYVGMLATVRGRPTSCTPIHSWHC